jgi:hypothetical protein
MLGVLDKDILSSEEGLCSMGLVGCSCWEDNNDVGVA